MALKMKENCQKNASAAIKKTLAIAPTTTNNTQKNYQVQSHTDCEDEDSIKGRFSWKLIDGFQVPYIIRIINGVKLKFVSVRMAEIQLLGKFLHSLHSDIYTCTSVRGYFITESEAVLLNNINNFHSDFAFGNAIFFARKDDIVLLDDVHEFYTFIDVCYKTLLFDNNTGIKEKCGFILINSESLVAYCIKDGQKYIPLFCFESVTENLQNLAVNVENWNLAYLKFCFKVQGIVNNEFFASDSCTVISLDDIKNFYSKKTNFEEHWPSKIIDTQLLTHQNSTHVNPPGVWIKTPLEEVIVDNSTIPHTLTESAPVLQQSMLVMRNIYQNGLPANQMDSALSQGSSLVNGTDHVVSPPPLVRTDNTAPVMDNFVSYSNVVPISQCMTTMYNPMINSNEMSHSNQMGEVYSQCAINSSRSQQQQIQQQQHQEQQKITDPQSQPSYYNQCQSVDECLTCTQLHSTLKNIRTEIINLLSSPSTLVSPTIHETSLHPNFEWKLTRIPERIWENNTNIAAYKIQKAPFRRRIIYCINANPYKYSDLMVTLDEVVKIVLPSCTVTRCAHILQKFLKTTLFSGNSEQLSVLRENGRLKSIYPEDTPMAMLQDIKNVLKQLKLFMDMQDEEIQQYRSAGVKSKRYRTS